jgi:hypothetical protein
VADAVDFGAAGERTDLIKNTSQVSVALAIRTAIIIALARGVQAAFASQRERKVAAKTSPD